MKTKIVCLGLALVASHVVTAQPVMTTYADASSSATENRLDVLSSVKNIQDSEAASATYASFAAKIVFPEGTTSVTFTGASYAVESWCNNVYTTHDPVGVNMALSKFNPEGDVSLPSIFARGPTNNLIVPINSNLVGTPIPNTKEFLITEQRRDLPQLVLAGDYWVLYRSLSGTYTVGGTTIPFSFQDRAARVKLVATPVIKFYADVFTATENRLDSLSALRKVEDTAKASATYASFAAKIVFPENTTSVTFTAASFAVESWINNVYTIHNPVGVNMAQSKFNPEGDVSTPSIFARGPTNNLIVPINSNLVGTPIPNTKVFLITEQKAVLPQLVLVGDYWVLYRSLSGTYTIDGATMSFPFSANDKPAMVKLVNETSAPINGVTMDYPNNPATSQITRSGGTPSILATGLTAASYNKSWWVETSVNLMNWSVDNTAAVSGNVIITIPATTSDPKRFWRISGLKP
jgi:hypothetical protein